MGIFEKFKSGLQKSSSGLSEGFDNIFSKKKLMIGFLMNLKN